MVNINIQKKDPLFLVAIMVLLVGIAFVIAYSYTNPIPNPGHGGDEVFIHINGVSKNLQQAIDDGNFSSIFTGGSHSGTIISGHKGEEIIVNIGGNIKSFQEAINDDSLTSAVAGTSPSNFGIVTGQNQTGGEILINISSQEKTLQQAINDGDFVLFPTAYINIGFSLRCAMGPLWVVTADITVTQNTPTGLPISGATVQGIWGGFGGRYSSTVSGATDANGQVSFTGQVIASDGEWASFTINSVTMGSDVYGLDGELSDSVVVHGSC